jgi:hypothetical protein
MRSFDTPVNATQALHKRYMSASSALAKALATGSRIAGLVVCGPSVGV